MTTPYQEGYEQGEWDTENRLADERYEMQTEITELRTKNAALEATIRILAGRRKIGGTE